MRCLRSVFASLLICQVLVASGVEQCGIDFATVDLSSSTQGVIENPVQGPPPFSNDGGRRASYGIHASCLWNIDVPAGKEFFAVFTHFDVEDDYDFLDVYVGGSFASEGTIPMSDGLPDDGRSTFLSLTGGQYSVAPPDPIAVSGPTKITFHFWSDAAVQLTGFKLEWALLEGVRSASPLWESFGPNMGVAVLWSAPEAHEGDELHLYYADDDTAVAFPVASIGVPGIAGVDVLVEGTTTASDARLATSSNVSIGQLFDEAGAGTEFDLYYMFRGLAPVGPPARISLSAASVFTPRVAHYDDALVVQWTAESTGPRPCSDTVEFDGGVSSFALPASTTAGTVEFITGAAKSGVTNAPEINIVNPLSYTDLVLDSADPTSFDVAYTQPSCGGGTVVVSQWDVYRRMVTMPLEVAAGLTVAVSWRAPAGQAGDTIDCWVGGVDDELTPHLRVNLPSGPTAGVARVVDGSDSASVVNTAGVSYVSTGSAGALSPLSLYDAFATSQENRSVVCYYVQNGSGSLWDGVSIGLRASAVVFQPRQIDVPETLSEGTSLTVTWQLLTGDMSASPTLQLHPVNDDGSHGSSLTTFQVLSATGTTVFVGAIASAFDPSKTGQFSTLLISDTDLLWNQRYAVVARAGGVPVASAVFTYDSGRRLSLPGLAAATVEGTVGVLSLSSSLSVQWTGPTTADERVALYRLSDDVAVTDPITSFDVPVTSAGTEVFVPVDFSPARTAGNTPSLVISNRITTARLEPQAGYRVAWVRGAPPDPVEVAAEVAFSMGSDNCFGKMVFTDLEGSISNPAPGAEEYLPDEVCEWEVDVPYHPDHELHFAFDRFDLEAVPSASDVCLERDCLLVYDGRTVVPLAQVAGDPPVVQRTDSDPYFLPTNKLKLKFISDSGTQDPGFSLTYQYALRRRFALQRDPSAPKSPSSGDRVSGVEEGLEVWWQAPVLRSPLDTIALFEADADFRTSAPLVTFHVPNSTDTSGWVTFITGVGATAPAVEGAIPVTSVFVKQAYTMVYLYEGRFPRHPLQLSYDLGGRSISGPRDVVAGNGVVANVSAPESPGADERVVLVSGDTLFNAATDTPLAEFSVPGGQALVVVVPGADTGARDAAVTSTLTSGDLQTCRRYSLQYLKGVQVVDVWPISVVEEVTETWMERVPSTGSYSDIQAAIDAAEAAAGDSRTGSLIILPPAVFHADCLAGGLQFGGTKPMTLRGCGMDHTVLDLSAGDCRAFRTTNPGSSTIDDSYVVEDLAITESNVRAVVMDTYSFSMRRVLFEDNSVGADASSDWTTSIGGALAVYSVTNLVVEDCVFRRNTSPFAGAAIGSHESNVNVSGCVFEGNSAGGTTFVGRRSGGALFAIGGGAGTDVLNVERSVFIGNTATGSGAGLNVHCSDLNLVVTDCQFTDNDASDDGGALMFGRPFSGVAACRENPFFITGTVFTDNRAASGGAVAMSDIPNFAAVSVIDRCTFRDNVAAEGGGGMRITVGIPEFYLSPNLPTVQLVDTTFTSNVAGGEGGALAMTAPFTIIPVPVRFRTPKLDIVRATVTNNTAATGGGLFLGEEAWVDMVSCTLTGNTASSLLGTGGAIAAERVDTLVINDAVVERSMSHFGAVSVEEGTDVAFWNTTFMGNTCSGGGCGLSIAGVVEACSLTSLLFQGNVGTDASMGGGLYFGDGSEVATVVADTVFNGNSADSGGAFAVEAWDTEDLLFVRCAMEGNSAGDGGAVFLSSSRVVFDNATVRANTATRAGGAVYLLSSELAASNCPLSVVSEEGTEAAAAVTQGSPANPLCDNGIPFLAFSDNEGFLGGGMYAKDSAFATLKGMHLVNNTASVGGAVYVDGGDLLLQHIVCEDNRASSFGGCVAGVSANLNVTAATMLRNMGRDGGAVALVCEPVSATFGACSSVAVLASIYLEANTAVASGGGLFVDDYTVTMWNITARGCTAGDNGGAVCVPTLPTATELADLAAILFPTRRAAGGTTSQAAELRRSYFENNTATNGGAVYLLARGQMSASVFHANTAVAKGGALVAGPMTVVSDLRLTSNVPDDIYFCTAACGAPNGWNISAVSPNLPVGANIASGPSILRLIEGPNPLPTTKSGGTVPRLRFEVRDTFANLLLTIEGRLAATIVGRGGVIGQVTAGVLDGVAVFDGLRVYAAAPEDLDQTFTLRVFLDAAPVLAYDLSVFISSCSVGQGDSNPDPNVLLCTDCAPGEFRNASVLRCDPCPPGHYSPDSRMLTCLPCPPGSVATAPGGRSQCTPCQPGSAALGPAAVTCDACDPGQYQPLMNQTACLPCAPGLFSRGARATECAQCEPGTFYDGRRINGILGTGACFPCPKGTYQPLRGSKMCLPCPEGSFANDEASLVCEFCGVGKFTLDPTLPCELCDPFVAECSLASVAALPGYWQYGTPPGPVYYTPCPQGYCPQGRNNCTDHRTGERCGECEEGYALVQRRCVPCTDVNWGVIFGNMFLVLLVTIYLTQYMETLSVRIKIFAMFGQVMFLLLEDNVELPSAVSLWGVFNLDFFFFPGDCLAPNLTPYSYYVLGLYAPTVLFMVAIALCWFVEDIVRKYVEGPWGLRMPRWIDGFFSRYELRAPKRVRYRQALIVSLFLSYLPVAGKVLRFMNCQKVHEGTQRTVLTWNIAVECRDESGNFNQQYISTLAASAFIFFFLLSIPIVVSGFTFYLNYTGVLAKKEVVQKYGVLYNRYRDGYFMWEGWMQGRKLIIAVIVAFAPNPEGKRLLMTIFLAIIMLLQTSAFPYRIKADNQLDVFLTICLTGSGVIVSTFWLYQFDKPYVEEALLILLILPLALGLIYVGILTYRRRVAMEMSRRQEMQFLRGAKPLPDHSLSEHIHSSEFSVSTQTTAPAWCWCCRTDKQTSPWEDSLVVDESEEDFVFHDQVLSGSRSFGGFTSSVVGSGLVSSNPYSPVPSRDVLSSTSAS